MKANCSHRALLGSFAAGAVIGGGRAHRRYRSEMALAYRRGSTGGRPTATAGDPIRYAEFGEGAPVLIVHGSGGGYDQGVYFAKVIGGDFRWIAPSRFGFPGTPVSDGANSALQAEVYAGLLDSLGIEGVGVVGVSLGEPSALLFAQRYPQRTHSLELVSAASYAIPPRPAALAALFKIFLHDFAFWALVRFRVTGRDHHHQ